MLFYAVDSPVEWREGAPVAQPVLCSRALERRFNNWFTVCLTPLGPWAPLYPQLWGMCLCVCVSVYMCVYVLQKDRANERKRRREGEAGMGGEDDTGGGFQGHCRAGFWALHQAHVYFINILPSCQSGRDSMRSPSPPSATHRGK